MFKKLLYFCVICACTSLFWNCPNPIDPGGGANPTAIPSGAPTAAPTGGPTDVPTPDPTGVPTPTPNPTGVPGPYAGLWQMRLGSTATLFGDTGYSIATNNMLIVVGNVQGDVDFNHYNGFNDPGERMIGTSGTDAFVTVHNLTTGELIWAKRIGGTASDFAYGVSADSNYIAVTGNIGGDYDADINGDGDTADEGEAVLYFGHGRMFLSVFGLNGNTVLTKRLGGSSGEASNSVKLVTVNSLTSVILTGYVNGSADIDGDYIITPGTDDVDPSPLINDNDIFIFEWDVTDNHIQMHKRLGGDGDDEGMGVAVSSSVFAVTGLITGPADLNGGRVIGDGGGEDTPYSGKDVFISVFNLTTYSPVWSKRLGGGNDDTGNSIAINGNGDIVVAGDVTGEADFDGDYSYGGYPESAANFGSTDAFIAVYDSAGGYRWAKRLGGTTKDSGYSVATDTGQRILVTGWVNGDADLDGNDGIGEAGITGEIRTAQFYKSDIFVSVFGNDGANVWSIRLGGMDEDHGYCITTDGSDNFSLTGCVIGDVDLNGDGDMIDMGESSTGYAYRDAFITTFLHN